MTNEIKYKYAENENGNVVLIDDAVAGTKYYCSGCKKEMIFKNGKIRQKHFSHKNTENCTGSGGEGYLHETFKKLAYQKIKEYINGKKPLEVLWRCNICNTQHNYNFLNGITDIKLEYSLEGCRPDLVLINENGNVPTIIEIVDSHEPEDNVIEFCKKYSIILIRIKLEDLDDLENIEIKLSQPSNVVVFNPMQCPVAVQSMQQRAMMTPIIQNRRIAQRGPLIDIIEKQMSKPAGQRKNNGFSKPYKGGGSKKRK